ncbi:MAG: cobalt ECF transporter T component CbiQ, partial [Candidatus Electrothrix sp. EH2]|nr:cobalt ECF transporter T component CbiQ [Candidatus Electrothrix sp. EH2]
NRGKRVQQAMELRGFTGRFYSLNESKGMQRNDLLLSAGLLLAGTGLVLVEILF